jgi:hypothetical protein
MVIEKVDKMSAEELNQLKVQENLELFGRRRKSVTQVKID